MRGNVRRNARWVSCCAALAAVVVGCGEEGGSPSLTDGIDRIVVRRHDGSREVEYTDPATVGAIVAAIESSLPDPVLYDTAMVNVIECYVGPDQVHVMSEGAGIFWLNGTQYRDLSGTLQQYVDDALAP